MKLGGVSSLGAGFAFIIDKFQTIVWKEVMDMRVLACATDATVCIKTKSSY